MATTEEILKAAQDLGKLIATHPATEKFDAMVKKLSDDVEAQRVLNDYHRQAALIADKESQQQPIEVDDKKKLEQLHQQVIQHTLLGDLQVVQMDYLDLMRRVDEAMASQTFGASGRAAAAAGSPLAGTP